MDCWGAGQWCVMLNKGGTDSQGVIVALMSHLSRTLLHRSIGLALQLRQYALSKWVASGLSRR